MIEQKKTAKADIEQRRTTGFLLGLIFVLSLCYVALEWNTDGSHDGFDPVDLSELTHESELVPMSNELFVTELREKEQPAEAERLRVVDDDVELSDTDEHQQQDDDEQLEQEQQQEEEQPLAPLNVDPANPLNFHIAEDLPQFPGGAVEFMKWLTRNLRYPSQAQRDKVQGPVVAVFYIETDGSVTGITITRSLSPECDREALRVLRMMPPWKPGIQNDQPCRTKVQIPIVFKL